MATQIAEKTKENQEPVPAAPRGGALTLFGDFPFFLSRMRDEFDQMFARFARQWPNFLGSKGWRWGLDVRDEDDTVVVKAEAPGFEAGDFDVRVSGNQLTLRAVRKVETKDKEDKARAYHEERECYESVTLPAGIDKDKVEATYHNGVLTVTLPKTPEGNAKQVPVKNG
jgi:HSP20 family protein